MLLPLLLLAAVLSCPAGPAMAQSIDKEPVALESRVAARTARAAPTVDSAGAAIWTATPTGRFFREGTERRAAGPHYEAGSIRSFFFGDAYRDVWGTPIDVPVIDLARTAGGLTPTERGGGLQTKSLHLVGADGHQYVLRSVDKDAARSLPPRFRRTIVSDVARDQTASMNPYGAFIIPTLAEAAGVLHTAPALVVIPDDPGLGEFREDYAGMLALFERKPDEDQSDAARFGFSTNIVGSAKLMEKVREDNDDRVDERVYARARLFDMLIGDWDRHDDQWRWAEFEGEHGTRFVAVPRDRDFAFTRFDGLFLTLARRTGNVRLRRLTNFDRDIDDLVGLNWQGSKLDLRFTSSLSRADWVALANELRRSLPDAVLEAAVRQWPDAVYDEIGAFTVDALKARRDQLPEVAEDYYEMLSHTVDVVGTDKHERFEVTRLNDDEVQVAVYKTKKDGEVDYELFRRTFLRDETEEVRLYGLGGDDTFVLAGGDAAGGLRVRAIGGEGEDAFLDRSTRRRAARGNYFYDTAEGNTWDVAAGTRVVRSDDPDVNAYEMHRFQFDRAKPMLSFDYDSDDGVFVGGGIQMTRHGFRKEPYAARHELSANYAPRSQAYNVRYEGDFVRIWNGWNGLARAEVLAADNFRNYYGLGNETPESARSRFEARLQRVTVAPELYRTFGRHATFGVGPAFDFTSVEAPEGLAEGDPRLGFTREQMVDKYFAGLQSSFVVDSRDSTRYPSSGVRWESEAGVFAGVRNTDNRYARLASELSVYRGFALPGKPAVALRVGGATNLGDFTFYQANTLGGQENLRGYRTTRFAGRSSAYANADLRLALAPFNVYLMRGTLGVLGFYDVGRVWADGEDSGRWHYGYGGGVWIAPFDQFLVTGTLGFSPEGSVFDLGFGFQF